VNVARSVIALEFSSLILVGYIGKDLDEKLWKRRKPKFKPKFRASHLARRVLRSAVGCLASRRAGVVFFDDIFLSM
jgi:hypothetical protein